MLLLLCGSFLAFNQVTPLPSMQFVIHPDQPRQTIENFGASDSWTVESLMNWPEADRQKIADLLFDQKKGIGLTSWRFNFGGGINHESINNPARTVETFEVSPGVYDWNRVPGQRWMLDAAKRAGLNSLIGYAVTPPKRLTRNGFTNGTDGLGSTNLKPGEESAYAAYLADMVEHFTKQGYPFTHISPINEPDFEWNGRPLSGSQEGNRASNADILSIGKAVSDEFKRRKLPVQLITPEANSPQIGYEENGGMTKKYGSSYGNYADLFAKSDAWRMDTNAIYAYHSYWADNLNQLIPNRKKLRQALDKTPGLKVWQTEYCQMAGPRGEGGWGRDLGMAYALNVARVIHFDMTIVEASAWQWWLAVSDGDYKDGLVYVDDLKKSKGTIFASKALWAMGNFSRFIRPGFQRIKVDAPAGTNLNNPWGILTSAYRDAKSGRVVIVMVNTETSSEEITFTLDGKWSIQPYITSDRTGDDLRKLPVTKSLNGVVPSRSVVTFVCDPAK